MGLPALDAEVPDLDLPALLHGRDEGRVRLRDLRGRWVVVFFYPADFSFICPTEVRGFARAYQRFVDAEAEVLAISPDDVATHRAWAEELGGIPYPMLSDADGAAARAWGALSSDGRLPDRSTYIVDPQGRLGFVMKVSRNVGRGVGETLRVLLGLRTGRLCPADWQPGDESYDGPDDLVAARDRTAAAG